MGFDEWFDNQNIENWTNKKYMLQAYEAGAASRQAEINELQKRIDNALECAEKCTWNMALDELKKILKGGLK